MAPEPIPFDTAIAGNRFCVALVPLLLDLAMPFSGIFLSKTYAFLAAEIQIESTAAAALRWKEGLQ